MDSINNDIDRLLNYEDKANQIKDKNDRAIFYQSISFSLYQETLSFEIKTKNIVSQYDELITSLENRLGIQNTKISYNLGAPLFDSHFNQTPINRTTLKNNFHYNQLESIKEQYLRLTKYHHNIIEVCENRISELLELLDRDSIDKIYSDIAFEKHIVVMNFTNKSNIEKYDKLTTTFSDMIINRYKDRKDISVTHSGFIDPDLSDKDNISLNDRLLIDGSFSIYGYDITINYKIYNVNDWTLYSNQNISCDVRDLECVYDNFLWHLDQSINPLIKNYSYDDFSDNSKKKIISDNISNSKRNDDLFELVLDDFVIQKDYSFNLNYKNLNIGENSNKATYEFNVDSHPNSINNRQNISNNLIKNISNFLDNPYDISIDDINMEFNKNDKSYVDLFVPVTFSININDFESLVKDFSYNTLNSRKDFNVYQFLYEDYFFNSDIVESFNDYKNEIFPVLFFSDKDNNIQKIIIDSWDSKYDDLLFGDYDVLRLELFSQLFSVIESSNSIFINMKKDPQIVNYQVTMPVSLLDNYTRLTVKIFKREELDKYLPITKLKF